MALREDNIEGEERRLLPPGYYFGHIWGVERKDGTARGSGEPYTKYVFTVRLLQDSERHALDRPARVWHGFWTSEAVGIRSAIGHPLQGKPCMVDLGHRAYLRDTGQVQLTEEHKPKIDPETGGVIPVMEDATTLEIIRVMPDPGGTALQLEQMQTIEAAERPAGGVGTIGEPPDLPPPPDLPDAPTGEGPLPF